MIGISKSLSAMTLAVRENALAIREHAEEMKTEFEWRKSHSGFATKQDLQEIEQLILMKNAETAALLDKLTLQSGKIAKEQSDRFDVLTKRIEELSTAIGDDTDPAVVTALANLVAAQDSLDAAIPDAPGAPVTPPAPDVPA